MKLLLRSRAGANDPIALTGTTKRKVDATITSSASFVLELYYEPSITPSFAEALAAALKDLIRALATYCAHR